MKTLIYNGRTVFGNDIIHNGWILIDGDKIVSLGSGKPGAACDRKIDAEGMYITPGFIDIHVHGGGGYDFLDCTEEAVEGASKEHMRHGTTSICPTTLSCPDEELFSFFSCYRQTKKNMRGGPNLVGIHLEGPYFSPEQAGAQDPKYLKKPTPESYMKLLDAGEGDIVRMSVAVELDGALELGDELKKRGILGAVGHSDAMYERVIEAEEHGFTHLTHFYSGMSSLKRIKSHRLLGIIETGYLSNTLTVEIISDGCHLPPELLRLIMKLIPNRRISLITDAMRGAGMPEHSRPLLGSVFHGQPTVVENGVAYLPDFSAFAGSVCTTDRCVRTVVKSAGCSMPDAIRMMCENPAKLLGIYSRKGRLDPGADADICIFDDDVNIKKVFVLGEQTV